MSLPPETAAPRAAHDVTHGDVAKGAGAALLSRLGAVIEIVAQPAYTLMFGLATYGLYTVLWSLVNLVENVADLGMTSALQRVVPQAASEDAAVAALRSALVLALVPCTLIAAGASIGAPWIADIVNVAPADRPALATGVALFAWALPLWAFIEIGTSALRARRAFGPEIRLRIVWEQVIRLVVATGLWLAGVDTLGLLIAHLVSLTITAAACVRLLSRYYDLRLLLRGRRVPGMMHETALAGLSVLPSNVIGRVFSDAPPVILNLLIPGAGGATAAGLYGIARKLSSLIQLVRMAFGYVMGPLASAVARHDRRAIQPLYGFATRLSTVLALPIAATIIAAADMLVRFFGKEAAPAATVLIPLAVARAVEAIGGPAGAVQQVASKRLQPVVNSLSGLAVAALVATVAFAVLPDVGPVAMALAVGAGLVVSSGFSVWQLHRADGLNPFFPPFGRAVGVALLACGAVFALLEATRLLPFAARVPLLPPIMFGGLWMSVRYGLGEADKDAFGKLAARLRLRRPEPTTINPGRTPPLP
ncbi:lipopolysaccharide biosynthesis protein [Sphingomonas solaris]|uniref:Lipopolysaccharide biosynthesis protein n=1 Tax=Alterirhizorhabdus solaris TaxID=2529389 RepID=A0A558QZE3_9SPHN|nr:oligosaccharide flippase family protein [Sphingomonas solaris]TVV72521.1 lipopolysaccharide biosynthesis protein [Sphingomonas solaris]